MKYSGKSTNKSGNNKMKNLIVTSLFLSASVFVFNSANAQDGAALFKQNCGACHTVGKGRLVGPDLSGVTTKRSADWLMKWTKSSTAFIASGDADAKAIYEEFKVPMPDVTIPEGDIKAIYAYVESKSAPAVAGGSTAPTEPTAPTKTTDNASADIIALGQQLFEGSTAFANNGPSCLSCHNVSYNGVTPGGLLAKDLTTAHGRLGGDAGIVGILDAAPFPAMASSYKTNPLTQDEIFAITAFLNKVNKDTANQLAQPGNPLKYGGPIALVGILILIFGFWFGRKKFSVKKDIYDRQLKSH